MVYSPSVFTVFAVGAVSCVLAAPIPAFISDSLAPTGGRSIETNPVSGKFNVVFDDSGNGVDVEQKHPEFEYGVETIEEEEIFLPHHHHHHRPFSGNDDALVPTSIPDPVNPDDPFMETVKELKATGILDDPEFLKELGEENPELLTAVNAAMELNVPNEFSTSSTGIPSLDMGYGATPSMGMGMNDILLPPMGNPEQMPPSHMSMGAGSPPPPPPPPPPPTPPPSDIGAGNPIHPPMVEDANISVGMSMSASVVAGASSGPSQTLSSQVTSQTPSKDVVSSDPFGPSQTSTSQTISSVSTESTPSPTRLPSSGDGSGSAKNGFNPKHIRLGLAAANAKLGATSTASDKSGPGSALPTPAIGDSSTSSLTPSPSTETKSGMSSSVVARSSTGDGTTIQQQIDALLAQQAAQNSIERAKKVDAAKDFFNTGSGSSVQLPRIQELAKSQNPKRRSVSSGTPTTHSARALYSYSQDLD